MRSRSASSRPSIAVRSGVRRRREADGRFPFQNLWLWRWNRSTRRRSFRMGLSSQPGPETPHNDSNLLNRHLKPAGKRTGAPWLSWHTFRRTHATLLSQAGASPRDAQAQLGHADIGTTMNIYTQPTPDHQRAAVERAGLVTNGDEFAISGRLIRQLTTLIQRVAWWAQQDSNLRLPPCEGGTLPLSYAPRIAARRRAGGTGSRLTRPGALMGCPRRGSKRS